jgi:cbb3-type cytochrome oxidase subunit 3
VAAGVALIGLAGLLPLGLVLALVWWIYATHRRRSRLQALDQI